MYHDNPDKEGSLPCLIQKRILVPRRHHSVFLIFSQEPHPMVNRTHAYAKQTQFSTQPEVSDLVE